MADLKRYALGWPTKDIDQPVLVPDDTGYWTPWHEAEAEHQRLREAQGWQPIDDSHKGGKPMLVALIRDGKVWRVSDAAHNGLGWYTLNGGVACHWATHAMPLPAPPLGVPRG